MEKINEDKIEWDESKSDDKEFLKKYYQSKLDQWSKKPEYIGGKVVAHYKKAVKYLS